MRDALLLLATGAGASLIAWAFWHYLGNDGFAALNSLVLVGAVADNFRLRRRLRERGRKVERAARRRQAAACRGLPQSMPSQRRYAA